MDAPASQAQRISVGVSAPGNTHFEYRLHISTVGKSSTGETQNSAPASMQSLAVAAFRTVPAPSISSSPKRSQIFSRSLRACGTVIVTSAIWIPAWWIASIADSACSAVSVRTIGMIPTSRTVFNMSCFLMGRGSFSRYSTRAARCMTIRRLIPFHGDTVTAESPTPFCMFFALNL